MEIQEGVTVGIDLGTTFSTLAYLDDSGNPTPVPNDDDDVETPSLILLADSGHVVVGPKRSRAAMEDPSNIVERIKRHMGESEFKRTFDGREITPEFLSALILKKLKQDGEKRLGKIGNAVITVPYYFNDARRKATVDAGKIAGLNVIDIINEPTAATLTYAWSEGRLGHVPGGDESTQTALVYDLGGGTFDVTVVEYSPMHFKVLATDGDVQLGGVDWSDRLAERYCQEFQDKHDLDMRSDPAEMQMLRYECDEAKIALSKSTSAVVSHRFHGKSHTMNVTRSQFEKETADLIQRTIDTSRLVIEQAGVQPSDLHAVVLVGGSTLMPWVAPKLTELVGKEPSRGVSPHTGVAQGAAIHAAILEAKYGGEDRGMPEKVRKLLSGVKQEDVNSHGLGIVAKNPKVDKYVNHVMIPRNSKLPMEVKQTFATNKDGQDHVTINVMEGDAPDPAACSFLGKCRIDGLPSNLPKGSPIQVTYSFDVHGRVHVAARDVSSGREATISIQRKAGLSDDQVDAFASLAGEYVVD